MKDCRYYDMCFRCGDECNGEPECPHRKTCQFYSPMPDLDALEALADKIVKDTKEDMDSRAGLVPAYIAGQCLRDVAKCIREALGVTS